MDDVFKNLQNELPAIIFRDRVGAIGLNARSMANADSKGEGPAGRFKIGKRVAYPRESFIRWLKARARPIESREA